MTSTAAPFGLAARARLSAHSAICLFTATTFTASTLVFLVQPMMAKLLHAERVRYENLVREAHITPD